jgi:hypothetical protein
VIASSADAIPNEPKVVGPQAIARATIAERSHRRGPGRRVIASSADAIPNEPKVAGPQAIAARAVVALLAGPRAKPGLPAAISGKAESLQNGYSVSVRNSFLVLLHYHYYWKPRNFQVISLR